MNRLKYVATSFNRIQIAFDFENDLFANFYRLDNAFLVGFNFGRFFP